MKDKKITVRTIKHKELQIRSTSKAEFSIYRYLQYYFPNNNPIRRLYHLARYHDVETMVIEELHEPDEIKEDNLQLKIRTKMGKLPFKESYLFRVSFFKNKMPNRTMSEVLESKNNNFIGYIIIKQNVFNDHFETQVYESVIKPRKIHNLYIHTQNSFTVTICGKNFSVFGTPFFQKNNLTTVCGHVSLSTFLSSQHADLIIPPHKINAILNIDLTRTRFGPTKGLSGFRIEKALKKYGYQTYGFAVKEPKVTNEVYSYFARVLYSSQESGFPSFFGFTNRKIKNQINDHLITIVGHTFDQDSWVPSADEHYFKYKSVAFESSLSWIESLIVHDDNVGAYYTLPIHYIEKEDIRYFVGVKSKEIVYDPFEIEVISQLWLKTLMDSFDASDYDLTQFEWLERLVHYIDIERVVLKTKIERKKNYLINLKKSKDWYGNIFNDNFKLYCKDNLPEKFWLVEFSFPSLFSTHNRKLGEIILDCQKPIPAEKAYDELYLMARFPGYYEKNPRFVKDLKLEQTGIPGHTEIFL